MTGTLRGKTVLAMIDATPTSRCGSLTRSLGPAPSRLHGLFSTCSERRESRSGCTTRPSSLTTPLQSSAVGILGTSTFGAQLDVNFEDLDLMAMGPIAKDVSAAFDEYWNDELAIPVRALVSEEPAPKDVEEARRDRREGGNPEETETQKVEGV